MKDFKFYKFTFLRFGFFLSWIASFVIVTSPLAMAEQSKKIDKEMLALVLKEMGVADNKDITMGEVWKRIRNKLPIDIRTKLDLPFQIHKDEKFPRLDISEVKSANDGPVIAMNVSDGTDVARVELVGKENTFLRLNGKNISKNDLLNLDNYLAKVEDEKFAKKNQKSPIEILSQQPAFPTYEVWKKMTNYERANYLVHMRLMMREVDRVLSIHEQSQGKGKKTSSLEREFEPYFRLLLGNDAEAAPAADKDKKKARGRLGPDTSAGKKNSAGQSGKGKASSGGSQSSGGSSSVVKGRDIAVGAECIVAGYPYGVITTHGVCTLNKSGKLPDTYTNGCPQRGGVPQISCNPILYGYKRGSEAGERICVDYEFRQGSATQLATTVSGRCEKESPLDGKAENALAMMRSMLLAEKKISPADYDKFFTLSSDGKTVKVEKAKYDELLASEPNGLFYKFRAEKAKAEGVCKPILAESEKKGYAKRYEYKETKQQTLACNDLLKRVLAVEAINATAERQIAPASDKDCDDNKTAAAATAPAQPSTAPAPPPAPVATLPLPADVVKDGSSTAPPMCPTGQCPNDSCHKTVVAGAADSENVCLTKGICEGEHEAVAAAEGEKEKKSSAGGIGWLNIAGIGLGIAALGALMGWGISEWVKKGKSKNRRDNPVVNSPASGSSLLVSPPAPSPIAPIVNSETKPGAPVQSAPASGVGNR